MAGVKDYLENQLFYLSRQLYPNEYSVSFKLHTNIVIINTYPEYTHNPHTGSRSISEKFIHIIQNTLQANHHRYHFGQKMSSINVANSSTGIRGIPSNYTLNDLQNFDKLLWNYKYIISYGFPS